MESRSHLLECRGAAITLFLSLLFVMPYSVAMAAPPSHSELPQLFRQRAFTADTLADAVNHYVSLGKVASIRELLSLGAHLDAQGRHAANQSGFYVNDRIGWVCRILFLPKGKEPLLQPRFGPIDGIVLSDPAWPLYPVVASGKSYFVLSKIIRLGSEPESIIHYLQYCQSHGTFRRKHIPVPTRAEALHDLERLRRSKEWQEMPWPDNRPLESQGLVLLISQHDFLARIRPQALDIR